MIFHHHHHYLRVLLGLIEFRIIYSRSWDLHVWHRVRWSLVAAHHGIGPRPLTATLWRPRNSDNQGDVTHNTPVSAKT